MKNCFIINLVILILISWVGANHLPKIKLKDMQNKRQELSQYYSDGPILINFWNLAVNHAKKK